MEIYIIYTTQIFDFCTPLAEIEKLLPAFVQVQVWIALFSFPSFIFNWLTWLRRVPNFVAMLKKKKKIRKKMGRAYALSNWILIQFAMTSAPSTLPNCIYTFYTWLPLQQHIFLISRGVKKTHSPVNLNYLRKPSSAPYKFGNSQDSRICNSIRGGKSIRDLFTFYCSFRLKSSKQHLLFKFLNYVEKYNKINTLYDVNFCH